MPSDVQTWVVRFVYVGNDVTIGVHLVDQVLVSGIIPIVSLDLNFIRLALDECDSNIGFFKFIPGFAFDQLERRTEVVSLPWTNCQRKPTEHQLHADLPSLRVFCWLWRESDLNLVLPLYEGSGAGRDAALILFIERQPLLSVDIDGSLIAVVVGVQYDLRILHVACCDSWAGLLWRVTRLCVQRDTGNRDANQE